MDDVAQTMPRAVINNGNQPLHNNELKNSVSRKSIQCNKIGQSAQSGSLAHPVFSDYSHLANLRVPDIAGLAFVAGLRSSGEVQGDVITRILPMTKFIPADRNGMARPLIIPDQPLAPPKVSGNHICTRDECVARRAMYKELTNAEKILKIELKSMKDKVRASVDALVAEERNINESEQHNESIRRSIDDIKKRIETLTIQACDHIQYYFQLLIY